MADPDWTGTGTVWLLLAFGNNWWSNW